MNRKAGYIIILFCCIVVFSYIFLGYQHTSAKRPRNLYTKEIERFHSSVDKDQDGVDDQQDILDNALRYVSTCPEYKSKYYVGGYPDDDYGVCTDVVGYALRESGYDLRELVSDDIRAHSSLYKINRPDKDIDFRRVRNLQVFFKRNAVVLTTQVSDLKEWQGGDIVVFKNHIGVVSDRRNRHGVPYIIHHSNPWQRKYEQDILERRNDIVGHYRISE